MGTLEIGVSGRSVGELRRLIGQAQARGETALARRLELDLNSRMRRMAARHADAAAGLAVPEAYAPAYDDPNLDADPPLGVARREPARRRPAWLRSARRSSAAPWQLAAAAVAGAAVASLAGWWITSADHAPRQAPAATAAPVPMVEAIAPAPAPAPAITVPATTAPTSPAPASPAPVASTPAAPASREPAACRAPATPGQQAVCASRTLLAQDQRMLRAYQHAIAAGANRPSLERAQARWRRLRDQTASPTRLAQLYRTRIATLEATAPHRHPQAHAKPHAPRRHHARR